MDHLGGFTSRSRRPPQRAIHVQAPELEGRVDPLSIGRGLCGVRRESGNLLRLAAGYRYPVHVRVLPYAVVEIDPLPIGRPARENHRTESLYQSAGLASAGTDNVDLGVRP